MVKRAIMKICSILIVFILSLILNQEVFAQENDMIQEGYMHFPVGEKYFHYKTNPSMALVEEVQNRCWFTATFVSEEDHGEIIYQFPRDMVCLDPLAIVRFFYFHTNPMISQVKN